MPVNYQLYPDENLVVVTYSGDLSLQDIIEIRKQGMADPDFNPEFHVIDDASAVTSTSLNFDQLSQASEKSIINRGVRRALVAVTDLQRGMANMYRVLSESEGHNFKVFSDIDEAKKWITADQNQ